MFEITKTNVPLNGNTTEPQGSPRSSLRWSTDAASIGSQNYALLEWGSQDQEPLLPAKTDEPFFSVEPLTSGHGNESRDRAQITNVDTPPSTAKSRRTAKLKRAARETFLRASIQSCVKTGHISTGETNYSAGSRSGTDARGGIGSTRTPDDPEVQLSRFLGQSVGETRRAEFERLVDLEGVLQGQKMGLMGIFDGATKGLPTNDAQEGMNEDGLFSADEDSG